MTVRTAPLAVLLALVLGLSGCSGGGPEAAGASSAGAAAAGPEVAAAEPAVAADLQLPRDVVRTATLDVEVDDLRAAADRARAVAEAAGGGLEAEDAPDGTDVLRLRVAPDRLDSALEQLVRLGRETDRTVGSEDVSEAVADLDSRLATQRASVERVRELLGRATVLSDVVALEGQLAQRESALESLQARAAALRARADLATVTLRLTVPSAVAAAGFGDGLSSGVDAFLTAARGAAVVLGALLPFLPLVLLVLWAGRRWVRRPV